MQIKTTVKYYFISTRMTLNKIGITDVGEDVEKLEHLCTLGTNLNLDSCLVKQYSSFFKKYLTWSINSTAWRNIYIFSFQ